MSSPFKDKNDQPLTWNQTGSKVIDRFYNYYLDAKVALLWLLGYLPSHSLRKVIFSLSGVKIGRRSTIHIGARFYQPKTVFVGSGTIIGDHATLDGRDKLAIGNHVDIASSVMILNGKHDINSNDFAPVTLPVEIKDFCFVGPRAIIMPGVTLGRGAVVAAGAVVTKSVPEKTIVAGIPARPIGRRRVKNLNYRLGRARLFQ